MLKINKNLRIMLSKIYFQNNVNLNFNKVYFIIKMNEIYFQNNYNDNVNDK